MIWGYPYFWKHLYHLGSTLGVDKKRLHEELQAVKAQLSEMAEQTTPGGDTGCEHEVTRGLFLPLRRKKLAMCPISCPWLLAKSSAQEATIVCWAPKVAAIRPPRDGQLHRWMVPDTEGTLSELLSRAFIASS